MAVSIAAQIATFPLGLLYFHQFPIYFLFGNLLAVPAAMIIVWVGVILLVLGSFSSVLGVLIGSVLSYFIQGLNFLLIQFQKLPIALIDDIYITESIVLFLYLMIAVSLLWLVNRDKTMFRLSIVMSIIVFALVSINIVNINKKTAITIYNIQNHWAIDFSDDGYVLGLSDELLLTDEALIDYQINPNRLMNGWGSGNQDMLVQEEILIGKVIGYHGKQILIANKPIDVDDIPDFIDYSLIPQQWYRQGKAFMNYNRVIYKDSSTNIRSHDLRKEGALVIEL